MVTPCSTCQLISCVNPPDFQTYSLETDAFFSPQFTFVVQCPTGYNCQPGAFPKTITIPAGTFTIPGPIPPANLASFPVQLKCCSSTLTAIVPSGSTIAQINAIMAGLFQQCAQQQALCNAIVQGPQIPVLQSQVPFTNDLFSVVVCPTGDTVSFSPALPPNFILVSTTLIIVAGCKSSFISKDDANAQAQAQLNAVAATATCKPPVFLSIVWDSPPDQNFGFGSATGTITSSQNQLQTLMVVTAGGGSFWQQLQKGTLNYTGPMVNGLLTITVVNTGISFGFNQTPTFTITDTQALVNYTFVAGVDFPYASGTTMLPFTIPAVVGDVITFKIFQSADLNGIHFQETFVINNT